MESKRCQNWLLNLPPISIYRSMKNVRGLEKNMEVENDHTIKHVRNELYQISE